MTEAAETRLLDLLRQDARLLPLPPEGRSGRLLDLLRPQPPATSLPPPGPTTPPSPAVAATQGHGLEITLLLGDTWLESTCQVLATSSAGTLHRFLKMAPRMLLAEETEPQGLLMRSYAESVRDALQGIPATLSDPTTLSTLPTPTADRRMELVRGVLARNPLRMHCGPVAPPRSGLLVGNALSPRQARRLHRRLHSARVGLLSHLRILSYLVPTQVLEPSPWTASSRHSAASKVLGEALRSYQDVLERFVDALENPSAPPPASDALAHDIHHSLDCLASALAYLPVLPGA